MLMNISLALEIYLVMDKKKQLWMVSFGKRLMSRNMMLLAKLEFGVNMWI